MKLKLLFFSFFLCQCFAFSQSQQLSETAKISVLTVGPGTYLNDAFGHNAFRIKDDSLQIDYVFNYGVYDFQAPNFYLKFAQGKLNYLIGADQFQDFLRQYTYQDRTIEEQVLNLEQAEKQAIYDFLLDNYKPENRQYLYDFFYDNCATKIRDVAEKTALRKINFQAPNNFQAKTFRALIHEHVKRNTWGSFGIDIALGSVIDKEATPYEHMYLPVYIKRFFQNANFEDGKPLVKSTKVLYEEKDGKDSSTFIISPLFIFGILSLLILWVTFWDNKRAKRSKYLDLLLFGFTGMIGVCLLLLWFATDHTATAFNYNLLWAFPLNLILLYQLLKKKIKNWVIKYLKLLTILLSLMLLHWLIGVQVFAIGLIPLLIALAVRYLYLIKYLKNVDLEA